MTEGEHDLGIPVADVVIIVVDGGWGMGRGDGKKGGRTKPGTATWEGAQLN
jgi:hypothetical protein